VSATIFCDAEDLSKTLEVLVKLSLDLKGWHQCEAHRLTGVLTPTAQQKDGSAPILSLTGDYIFRLRHVGRLVAPT
jgi:hypothetical protein